MMFLGVNWVLNPLRWSFPEIIVVGLAVWAFIMLIFVMRIRKIRRRNQILSDAKATLPEKSTIPQKSLDTSEATRKIVDEIVQERLEKLGVQMPKEEKVRTPLDDLNDWYKVRAKIQEKQIDKAKIESELFELETTERKLWASVEAVRKDISPAQTELPQKVEEPKKIEEPVKNVFEEPPKMKAHANLKDTFRA